MRYLSVLPLVVLAACSSSDDGSSVGSRPSAAELAAVRTTMDEIETIDMPTTGTAAFEGEMVVELGGLDDPSESATLTSDLDIEADFASNEVSGTASNFRVSGSDIGDIDVTGTGTVSGGLEGSAIFGDINGEITASADGETVKSALDLEFSGDFVTDDPTKGPQGAFGTVDGSIQELGGDEGELMVTTGEWTVVRR